MKSNMAPESIPCFPLVKSAVHEDGAVYLQWQSDWCCKIRGHRGRQYHEPEPAEKPTPARKNGCHCRIKAE
ncbi:hypothetical protein AOLI_G00072540 [Acnodon oligacanthus]